MWEYLLHHVEEARVRPDLGQLDAHHPRGVNEHCSGGGVNIWQVPNGVGGQ